MHEPWLAPNGYTVSQLLYEDSFTQVHRGIDQRRRCGVILQSLRGDAPDARHLARMRRDYELASQLSCAGVMRAMALVEQGRSLVLVREDSGGELLSAMAPLSCPLEDFFPLALSLLDVLERIHRRRVIHLGLKPQCIFFDKQNGRVHLADFGLASQLSRQHPQLKRPEQIEGSLPYLAPEQTGLMNRVVDFRADYYAMGVVFYQLLTGQLPFKGGNALEWVHCHLARPPRPPQDWAPNLPQGLSALVLKLLSKLAEDRYRSAAGLRADLLLCRLCWQQGQDPVFALARADISEQLQLPQKLYGREQQVERLLSVFKRVAHSGCAEWVLVSGYSGVGKTALVAELYQPAVAHNARYISGKFDQYRQGIPYAPLAEAFRSLVQQLLAEGPEQIEEWRGRLQMALRDSGQVIVDLIPLIEHVIGPQPPLVDIPPDQAQHRARDTFQRFIGVFTAADHPLVLFLDDLQWVDPASLSLLEQLSSSPETRFLMLVGAYRENEVGPSHPLTLTLANLRRRGCPQHAVELAPLADTDLMDILADTLHCTRGEAEPLAELVYAKTRGNPFFCFQFITALCQDELLRFDAEQRRWVWNLEKIQARGFTDNVVDLMVGELRRLPAATRRALQLGSFLGNEFDRRTLSYVLGKSELECQADVWPAQQIGLLIAAEGGYCFLHDRVQEAAFALTAAEERAATHLHIGSLMLRNTPEEDLDECLFDIVAHLDEGASCVADAAERKRYALLNQRAGFKAQAATAYPAACGYFAAGMTMLAPNPWARDPALAYRLQLARAECEYLSGRFGVADALIDEILASTGNAVDRARCRLVKIRLQVTRGDNPGACEVAQTSLIELGVHLPLRPTQEQVREAYREIQALMQDRTLDALIDLPEIADPEKAMAVRVLTGTSTAAIFTDQSLWALHDTQMVVLSLRHGVSDDAVMAFMFYGFMLGAYLHRYQEGYRYTEIAYRLMERRRATQHRGNLVYHQALAALWVRPIDDGVAALSDSMASLLETGNMVIACLSLRFKAAYQLLRGDPLEEVERATLQCRLFALEKRYPVVVALNEATATLVQRLRNRPAEVRLDGGGQIEPTLDGTGSTDRIPFVIVAEHLSDMTWQCIMGCYAEARRLLRLAEPLMWAIPGLLPNYDYFYYGSVSLAADFDVRGPEEQARDLASLNRNLEQLRLWAESNPTTFSRSYLLVAAEIARIEGRTLDAMRLYEQAVVSARAGAYVQDEAFASERAAYCYRELGLADNARAQLRNAYRCYTLWGAEAKLRWIEFTYPEYGEPVTSYISGTDTGSLAHLDALAIARATQAISGQIVQENLLQTLLRITLEHAAAQSAAILLVQGEKLRVAATATAGVEDIDFQLYGEHDELPLPRSILSYVQHSREMLVLNDAFAQRPFASDPYLRENAPASLVCLPIMRQGTLVGAVYLEHRSIPQMFTEARLAVLEQLAVQAAISLENAQLYGRLDEHSRTLEEKVAQRTDELRATIQDLETFSTTLSHDLQAPLRHISGFARLLQKRYNDALDATGRSYLDAMTKSTHRMDQLITQLLDYSRTRRAGMKPATVELESLVHEIREELAPDCGTRHIEWRIHGLPRVVGDRALLRPMLINLVGNAIKYTRPRDPAIIEIGCVLPATVAGPLVTLYVRDNGVGFNPSFTHKLFGEFQRLHDAAEFEGSGIGLVSVRRIIERHGGKVWAEGTLDAGATFYFSLPAADAGEQE